ncbi:MAG: hypothetical protein RL637_311 [Pseudomonadota bacterium]
MAIFPQLSILIGKKYFQFTTGFSLIELLVVLVIISLSASLIAPKLFQRYQRFLESEQLNNVVQQLQTQRLQAWHQGKSFLLNTANQQILILPLGWHIHSLSEFHFLANGLTNGGDIKLISNTGKQWTIHFSPLDGKVELQF